MKNIPIKCQLCNTIDRLPNLGTLHDFVERKWDLIWQNMTDSERTKVSMSKVVGYIPLTIDPKKIRKGLEQTKHILFYCRTCMAIETAIWYDRNGYHVVRMGNVVVDINFYEEHKDEVKKVLEVMRK